MARSRPGSSPAISSTEPWAARARAVAALVVVLVALAGCARGGEETLPVACKSGPGPVGAALRSAPEQVRIDGTPLSSCLARSADSAELQAVGAAYIEVAADLAPQARREPEGPEAEQLGYLTGAVRRGAARTQGIHDELLRRLEQELLPVDTGSTAFREGERAGRASG